MHPVLAFIAPAAVSVILGAAPSAYVTHSTTKIRPSTPVPVSSPQTIELGAARNEFEAFQIVVHGGDAGLRNVRVSVMLSGFPQQNVWIYREALLNLTYKSNPGGATGWWPDPLIPDRDEFFGEQRNAFPFDVPPGESRAVWVDLLVPVNQLPGRYPASIQIAGDGFGAQLGAGLEVWNFTLPSTPSFASMFDYFGCRGHYPSGCTQAQGDELEDIYRRSALDHRTTIGNVGSVPRTGGQPDWAAWDRNYKPFLDGLANTRLQGARLTTVGFRGPQTAAEYSAWARHFRDMGWFERLFDYTCDEPYFETVPPHCTYADLRARASIVRQGDPEFKTLTTSSIESITDAGVLGLVDILVPLVSHLDWKDPDVIRQSQYTQWLAGGSQRRLWWYFACWPGSSCVDGRVGGEAGWPNYIVDAPAIENRIMAWLSYRYGISTELYWSLNAFSWYHPTVDPLESIYLAGNNGDGTLYYPGTPGRIGGTRHIPIASIRLKMIREGREDYEYLHRLEELGDKPLADQLALIVGRRAWSFTHDPEVLFNARKTAAQRIVALQPPDTGDGGTNSTDGGGDAGVDGGLEPDGGPMAQWPVLLAAHAPAPPTVDGDLSEFSAASGAKATTASGAMVALRALWDDQALYLAAEVTDRHLHAQTTERDGALWSEDSIEVLVDTLFDRSPGELPGSDDYKFYVSARNTQRDDRGNGLWGTWNSGWESSVKIGGSLDDDSDLDVGYAVEVRIPWASWGIASPVVGTRFGFDFNLNDARSTGSVERAAWANLTGGTVNDPAGFGELRFQGEPATVEVVEPPPKKAIACGCSGAGVTTLGLVALILAGAARGRRRARERRRDRDLR